MDTFCSHDTTTLAKALLDVQKRLAPAPKDANNPFTKSNYATLNSVMATCRDILLEHGIWLCQYPVPVEAPSSIGLATKLTHVESGQWQSSLAVVPLPKADPQSMGSAITYARRYALTAMLGMVTEDDDGEAARIDQKSITRTRRAVNAPQYKPSQDGITKQGSSRPSDPLERLPKLDGIAYQIVESQDGRECIIATGNTQPKKEILKGAGFHWSAERKFWWRYRDAA